VVCEDSLVTLSFPSPRDALEHLAKTGSNAVTRRAWTRRALADFDDGYRRRFACGGSVPLTYHPVLLIARRSEPHVGSVRHRH
jgi:malonyl-CoA O-methyltransferase